MTKIALFTDPHLGTDRQAHTTRASAKALQQSIYEQTMQVVNSTTLPMVDVSNDTSRASVR